MASTLKQLQQDVRASLGYKSVPDEKPASTLNPEAPEFQSSASTKRAHTETSSGDTHAKRTKTEDKSEKSEEAKEPTETKGQDTSEQLQGLQERRDQPREPDTPKGEISESH